MKLLTPQEVADSLVVSRDTVSRLIASGLLPAVLISSGKRKKTYRIREEVLDAWVLAREGRGEAESGNLLRKRKIRLTAKFENDFKTEAKA